MRRRDDRAGKLALLLASLVLALLAAEAGLRLLRPVGVGIVHQPCLYEPDEELGYRYRPGAHGWLERNFEIAREVTISRAGFHDVEAPIGEGRPRIAVLGDSFTSAIYLPPEQGWTQRLERELRARGIGGARVVNLGLDGTGTDVHLDLLRRELPRVRPHLVLLAFFGNDLEEAAQGRFRRECHHGYLLAYQTPGQRRALVARVERRRAARGARWLFERSYLFRLLAYQREGPRNLLRMNFALPTRAEVAAERAGRPGGAPDPRRLFEAFESLARRHGFRFVVVPVPPRRSPKGSLDQLRRTVPGLGSRVLDVTPDMAAIERAEGLHPRDLYWRHDSHLNAAGNRVFAAALARRLRAELQPARTAASATSSSIRSGG